MSKTSSNSTSNSTKDAKAANPFTMDPASILEAQRRAAVSGIDGLLALQDEMRKAFETGLGRVRSESESWARLSNEIATESLATSFDLAHKALSTWKDEVATFGRADA